MSIHYNEEAERLVIGVSDHGKGLSSSEQARIFGPFQRLENKRPVQVRGAGLSLVICRRLVEAHGGEIWVESKKVEVQLFSSVCLVERTQIQVELALRQQNETYYF